MANKTIFCFQQQNMGYGSWTKTLASEIKKKSNLDNVKRKNAKKKWCLKTMGFVCVCVCVCVCECVWVSVCVCVCVCVCKGGGVSFVYFYPRCMFSIFIFVTDPKSKNTFVPGLVCKKLFRSKNRTNIKMAAKPQQVLATSITGILKLKSIIALKATQGAALKFF